MRRASVATCTGGAQDRSEHSSDIAQLSLRERGRRLLPPRHAPSFGEARMAHVTLTGNLRQLAGGVAEMEIEAGSVRQLLARLGQAYPALVPHLEEGVAVAIDGQIYQDALL